MQDRENFYVLLGLSIEPQEQDEEKIRKAINKKRSEWSQLRNHPTKAVKAKFYLSMLPEINKVMLESPYTRKEEWKQAVRAQKEKEKVKFEFLDECIEFLCSKGCIFEDEIKALQNKFDVFSKDEIMKRIKVPVHLSKNNALNKIENIKQIDVTIINKIKANLEIVKAKSLYEFLEISKASPISVLKMASKYKYGQIRKIASKDAVTTAQTILQGLCDDIFKDEESKKSYDEALKKEKLEYITVALSVAAAKGYVSSEEFDNLVVKLVGQGFAKVEAEDYVKKVCAKKGISLQVPKSLAMNLMEKCSVCGSVNYKSSKFCFNCGFPIKISCPKCHRIVSTSNKICNNCGFSIKNMLMASECIRNAEMYVETGRVEKAYLLLTEAQALWPENQKAAEIMKSVKTRRIIVAEREAKIQELVLKNQYYTAMKELIALKRMAYSEFIDVYENIIGIKIAEAQKYIEKASETEDEDILTDIYSKVLNICSDCDEALKWLSKYPPKPPVFLEYSLIGDAVNITWDKNGADKNVCYRIIRKMRSEPKSIEDGKFIGDTFENKIVDYTAEAGQNYYYAIFACRGSIYSKTFSILGPIMRIADVDDVEVEAKCGRIILSWSTETKTKKVEVWRKTGALPEKRGDGVKLEDVSLFGVEDENLFNGQNYGYRIIAIYKDSKDREVVAEGITCFGKPMEPPEVITEVKLLCINGGVKVNFERENVQGKVYILYSNEPFEFEEGQVITRDKINKIRNKVVVKKEGECEIKDIDEGVLFVLPVAADGDVVSVGKQQHISFLKDVEDLNGYILNKKLYLQWKWPANTKQVLIAWKFNDFCKTINDSTANYKNITYEEYIKDSAFIIDNLNEINYFFTVFNILQNSYEIKYSYGNKCKVRNAGFYEIFYEVKRSKGIFGMSRGASFILKNKGINAEIPEYILVSNSNREPRTIQDGNIVYSGNDEKVLINSISDNEFLRPFFKSNGENEKYKFVMI